MSSAEIIPIGKYKGQTIDAVVADTQYREWLMSQEWFRERFAKLYGLIAAMSAPVDSPEHNLLQARFLEDRWCRALICAYHGRDVFLENQQRYEAWASGDRLHQIQLSYCERLAQFIAAQAAKGQKEFDEAAAAWPRLSAEYDKAYAEYVAKLAKFNREKAQHRIGLDYPPSPPWKREPPKREDYPSLQFDRGTNPWPTLEQVMPGLDFDESEIRVKRVFEAAGADLELVVTGGWDPDITRPELHLDGNNYVNPDYVHEPFEKDFRQHAKKYGPLPSYVDEHLRIEFKVGIGEDYPHVLRQAIKQICPCVLTGSYRGTVELESVRAIFKSQGVTLLVMEDLTQFLAAEGTP